MDARVLLTDARLPDGSVADVALGGGRILAIRPAGADRRGTVDAIAGTTGTAGAARGASPRIVALDGRWLRPGLWDAHVHVAQWARSRGQLDVSGAASAADVCAALAVAPEDGPLIAAGFRWAGWPSPPTLAALDAARAAPTVALSGDLHSAWVNSAAAAALRLPRAGLLVEGDAFLAQRRLAGIDPDPIRGVDGAARAAATRGVVGIVDLEFADNATAWSARVADGVDLLRVEAGFYPDLLDARIAAGATTGADVPGTRGLVRHGPLKVISDGSLNSRTAHCLDPYDDGSRGVQNVAPEQLAALLARARAAGIRAAVHALGDAAVRIALDAFAATGARGTIEHAQLIADADLPRFAALGVTASVQPAHALDDREVAARLWPGRTGRAFPLRSLLDAGARVALGSDAPVAPLDPWVAIAAAVHRADGDDAPWHPEQSLTVAEALACSARSRLAPGGPADLIALDADPVIADRATLRAMPVALTLLGGRVTHDAR
ncbi:amidohydrolase [Demequina pelophila]|uniref:amidohydrolase n=1 Tax=Demequina pelophila TaxID=1638984 RepID=UPI000780976E|nr:amidohydrolase family protein [Demequina pelophila]